MGRMTAMGSSRGSGHAKAPPVHLADRVTVLNRSRESLKGAPNEDFARSPPTRRGSGLLPRSLWRRARVLAVLRGRDAEQDPGRADQRAPLLARKRRQGDR